MIKKITKQTKLIRQFSQYKFLSCPRSKWDSPYETLKFDLDDNRGLLIKWFLKYDIQITPKERQILGSDLSDKLVAIKRLNQYIRGDVASQEERLKELEKIDIIALRHFGEYDRINEVNTAKDKVNNKIKHGKILLECYDEIFIKRSGEEELHNTLNRLKTLFSIFNN